MYCITNTAVSWLLLLCRLLKKPGRRSRKKKIPNVSNTPIVKTADQPHNSSDTHTISTNDISKRDGVEISRTSIMGVKQCNELSPPTEAMSVNKEIISTNKTCDTTLSVISEEVDVKSTRTIMPNNEPIISGDVVSNDTSFTRENDEVVDTANSFSEEILEDDALASVPAEAVNTANSSSEESVDGDTLASEAVEVESVRHDDNCDCVTDKETPSISDGEILSDGEDGNPDENISHHDNDVSTRQPSSRRNSRSDQSRHQNSHHTDHPGQFGRQSDVARSRLNDHLDSQDRIEERHDRSCDYQTSSQPHSPIRSRDSSKLLHHNSSRSLDSSKRLHRSLSESQSSSVRLNRTSSESHHSSKRLHHSSSESHDSPSRSGHGSHDPTKRSSHRSHDLRSRHASSGSHHSSNRERHDSSTSRDLRSHDPSKRSRHHSSGSHDTKFHHVSSRSLHSSRSHPASTRSHGPSKTLHHSSSGSHDSKGDLHSSHNSSKIMCHNSNGSHVEKFSSTTSRQSPQCSSTSDQSRRNKSDTSRGPKRHGCSHDGLRDTPAKRYKLTHATKY